MTKADLERMQDLSLIVKHLEWKKQQLFNRVTSMSQILSDLPKTHRQRDRMAEYMESLEEIENKYKEEHILCRQPIHSSPLFLEQ